MSDPAPSTGAVDDAAISRAALGEAAVTGIRWMAVARIAAEAAAFGSAIALARLVPPAEFGRAAVPLVITPLAVIVTFEACGSVLVQRREIGRDDVAAATLLSLLLGAVLSLLLLALAHPLGGRLFGGEVGGLLALSAPVFLLAAIGAVPRSLLQRRLAFRALGVIETISLVFGAGMAIGLALAGLDAEAIVLGTIAGVTCQTALLVLHQPPALPRWSRAAVAGILEFGVPASLAGVLSVVRRNVDYAILAARVSAGATGLYWRAFQLGVEYQDKVSGIMLRLVFPLYSRTTDLDDLRALRERVARIHAVVLFPLLGILVATAPVLVPWLFGERWQGAVEPTQILAAAGMVEAVLSGSAQVMYAAGKPRPLMVYNGVSTLGYAVVILLASRSGLVVVAVAAAACHVAMLLSVQHFLFGRLLGIGMADLWRDIGPALVATAALLAVAFPLTRTLMDGGMPAVPLLAAVGAVGLAVYGLVLRAVYGELWRELLGVTRRVLERPLAVTIGVLRWRRA